MGSIREWILVCRRRATRRAARNSRLLLKENQMERSMFAAIGFLCEVDLFDRLQKHIPHEIPSRYDNTPQPVRMWKVQNPSWETPSILIGTGYVIGPNIDFISPSFYNNIDNEIERIRTHLEFVIRAVEEDQKESVEIEFIVGIGERILTNPADKANKYSYKII